MSEFDHLEAKEIKQKISELVELIQEKSKTLQGISGPSTKNSKLIESTKLIETMRGRPLFFPYLGSGLGNGAYV